MTGPELRVLVCYAAVLVLQSSDAGGRKNNIPTGMARRKLGEVAAFQGFPHNVRINRAGSVEVCEEYYHIFTVELRELRRWRTLVFDNCAAYLGYYETVDQLAGLEKDGLLYPGEDDSIESGDAAEGEFDSGNAHRIAFGVTGPPDEIKCVDHTYRFISSPARIRPEDPSYRFLRMANRVAASVNQGRYGLIRDYFSTSTLKRISEQQTESVLSGVREKLGRVKKVEAPWIQAPGTAVLPIFFDRAVVGLKLTLDDHDKIVGMWVLPFKTAFPAVGTNRTDLILPVKGTWRLMWGGRERGQSKYFGSRVSHHALEFVISSRFGKTYCNDGKINRDYYAYGQPVFAPAAGTVVAVVNGIPDNKPGAPNPFDRLGNAVMIQHSDHEFTVVGHLMNDSAIVSPGDVVSVHQLIARCGNSGDSTQPGVYFHVQDSPDILSGSGYRPLFSDLYVWRGGAAIPAPTCSPVRGDFVLQRSGVEKAAPPRQRADAECIGKGLGNVKKSVSDS